jgi:hypothetical protein
MYRVSYYISGSSKIAKTFATLTEAIKFSNSHAVGLNNLYQIIKE